MREEFKELLNQEGISDLENLTEVDIEKVMKLLPKLELNTKSDETIIQEYYKFLAGILPITLRTINDLATKNLGKEVINSFNKRIDTLNKRYENEKDTEVLKLIQQEISSIYDRIENESDKQRAWITNLAFGAMGTVVVLGGIAVGVKNKDIGKKIVEEGIKVIKG